MRLYNTLTRKIEDFTSLEPGKVAMYSCGPTVYDHIHIGNLSAFVAADTLRRVLVASGYQVKHVMNFTDVDDKTIRRSRERYPDDNPETALTKLTGDYKQIFLADMQAIGNDVQVVEFVDATASIDAMRELIRALYQDGFAYLADDGVYFSIEKYRASGKTYGQLLNLTTKNTSSARINNDEYGKDSAHDFALWKTRKADEPAWDFELDGRNILGRPGWHVECSAMSAASLGQPFDIHTGGIDLIFPHHENEIAQSTAGRDNTVYAKYFVHNEHLLVDGRKMSKSLNNFYTLRDVQEKGFDPLAFRMAILQSHYRSQANFSWENLEAASNRLASYRAMADLRFQPPVANTNGLSVAEYDYFTERITIALQDDLNTPEALTILSTCAAGSPASAATDAFRDFLTFIDCVLGLNLNSSSDITDQQKQLIAEREAARQTKSWETSDKLRARLSEQGILIRDTDQGPIWSRP